MAEKYILNFEANTSQAVKSVDKLDDSIKDTSKSTGNLDGALGSLDQASGGLVTKFKGLTGGLKQATQGFKTMRLAIISTGIGALVVALGSLAAAFTASEEGQNKFAKLMNTIGVVTNNVLDIFADLGESLFALGKALFKLATGDLKGASAAWVEVKENVSEVVDGIKNFGEETRKEIKLAQELSDTRAKADKIERQLIVDRAKADRQRAKLLEQAVDKEQFSVEQRIGFLEEAGRLEEEITNKEIVAARLRLQAKIQENSLSKSTKEELDEEARLKAELIQLETARLTKQKEVTSQTIALKAEEAAALKAIEDQKIAEQNEADIAEIERLKNLAEQKKIIKDKELADSKAVADAELTIKNASMAAATSAFSLLASTDQKNKKLQAAMLIATNAVGIAQNIINTNAANARLTLEGGIAAPALILANKIRMFTGIAASVAATAQGLSALKVGGSATGGAGASASGGTPIQQPSFNIVGQGQGSQIATALGEQQQQPVQAFVVSQDVTTAQSLENGIISGATLGG